MSPSRPRSGRAVPAYFGTASTLLVFLLCARFLVAAWPDEVPAQAYLLVVHATYACLYALPAVLAASLLDRLLVRRVARPAAWRVWTVRIAAVVATAATLLLLHADWTVFRLFGFHINGFVWNVVTTPGGIESMDGGPRTAISTAVMALGFLGLQGALLATLVHLALPPPPRRLARPALAAAFLLSAGERLTYGAAHARGDASVLVAAEAFPWYARLTFDRLAARLGIEDGGLDGPRIDVPGGLRYPLAPPRVEPPETPLNVVWLVAESWRADALDPDVMPRASAFAERCVRFDRHYSGGNGTRMGMFSMFYGLHGPSWFHVLAERTPPVLLDVLRLRRYAMDVRTSARFTYPEFDRTIFSGVDPGDMHEQTDGFGWQRDRRNVDEMLAFVDARDQARPFFAFQFFESPHARYDFPDECAVFTPYADELDYASLDLEREIDGIRNRYLNCCRHLDGLIGRVVDGLEERGLLERTIVVVTGDHGEEFLEHGRWGHGSTFVDEQTRVPLLVHVPGVAAERVTRLTSHVDLPATLLPLLGVQDGERELSLGHDLLGPFERRFAVICDWNRLCYVDGDYKAWFSVRRASLLGDQLTTGDDRPEADREAFLATRGSALAEVMAELARFRRHRERRRPDELAGDDGIVTGRADPEPGG